MSEPQIATLGIHVDANGLKETAEAMERLSLAIQGVVDGMKQLEGLEHGGMTFTMAGPCAKFEVTAAVSETISVEVAKEVTKNMRESIKENGLWV